MSILHDLLESAVVRGASDIHLKPHAQPYFRVNGQLVDSQFEILTVPALLEIADSLMPPHLRKRFETEHEADFSLDEEGVGRFRINVFQSQSAPTLALRHVKTAIPTFEELRLPALLAQLALWRSGIIMLTGTTGSGKSTTVAAIVGEINRTQKRRIVTIEDPVEYLFVDDQSVITQREVGIDTLSFSNALKHLMRQDPDVILLGEMRDATSIRTGILAAETGHLVLTTLHAANAAMAIPRILDVFPKTEQTQILRAFSGLDFACICQRLIPDTFDGVVPATEVMMSTPTVRKLIEKNQLDMLSSAIEVGTEDGMRTFNQSIYELIKGGLISEANGMRFSTNPQALRMNLQGIFLDEAKRILQV